MYTILSSIWRTVFLKKNETNKIKHKIMPNEINWGNIATNAIGQVGGALLGGAMNIGSNNQQLHQQQALMDMQIRGQNRVTDYNYQKQMQMWNETNYAAQMEQLKKAGLNPGLLYKSGGAGGQTSVNTGNVTGATAPNLSINKGMAMQLGQQATQNAVSMENIQADTELKKANANLTNVQAGKTQGVDTDKATAEIELIKANTGNIEQDKINKEINEELLLLQKELEGMTLQDKAKTININIKQLEANIKHMELDNKLKSALMNTTIKQAKASLITTQLENQLKEWNINIQPEQLQSIRLNIEKLQQDINYKGLEFQKDIDKFTIEQKMKLLQMDLKKIGLGIEQEKIVMDFAKSIISGAGAGIIMKGWLKSN